MNITVYCGASLGTDPAHLHSAQLLGKWIAEQKHTLVYGGGKAGLMGALADTVLANNGTVIGIMPTFLQERELAHPTLSEMITVNTMSERKLKMIELGDAYIALAGGPGTLEEISEVISWARIGQNKNPCILFNSNGYYQLLEAFFNNMVEQGFLSLNDRKKILFSNNLSEIDQFIQHYTPPEIRRY